MATQAPSFMQTAPSGKDNIDQSDMVIPRLALAQSVSKEVEEGKVDAGSFYHTILEEDLGQSVDDLIIIHISKRYNLWNPRHAGGGILARASDGKRWDEQFRGKSWEVQPDKQRKNYKVKWEIDATGRVGRDIGLGAWGTGDPGNEDSPPAATLVYYCICMIASRPEMGPFAILLQRSAEPIGKQLSTKLSLDNAPIYGQVYRLGQKVASSASGDYFQYTFTKNGYVQDEALFNKLREAHEQMESIAFKVDETDEDPADAAQATGGGGGDSPNDRY